MPADQRGSARKLPSGLWQLRYFVGEGKERKRLSGGVFKTETAAHRHFRDVIEPELNGRPVARRDLTLSELVDLFLERHGKVAKPATVKTIRWRMKRPLDEYGDTLLGDLEHMADDLAGFAARQPERFRHAVMSALGQTPQAGVRYGLMTKNPARLAGPNRRRLLGPFAFTRRRNARTLRRNSTIEEPPPSGSPRRPDYDPRSGRTSSGGTSTGQGVS